MKAPIEAASTVTLHLSLTLEDGTVAESTFGEEPLTFTMGDGTLVHGLELALYGLLPGAVQRLELRPEQAWGLRDPANIHAVARADFDPAIELKPGVIVAFETADGDELAGAILSVGDDSVEVDFNHPLAGHTLVFEVEILDVVPAVAGGEQ
jgi:FKBP-type peptidyl-prolyl cis-trans isomerase SlpA